MGKDSLKNQFSSLVYETPEPVLLHGRKPFQEIPGGIEPRAYDEVPCGIDISILIVELHGCKAFMEGSQPFGIMPEA